MPWVPRVQSRGSLVGCEKLVRRVTWLLSWDNRLAGIGLKRTSSKALRDC